MTLYLWIKAFHIIAVISWMAGLLYLPRLFVYHTTALKGGEASEMLKVMEHRLLRFIMNPAMILTWILGLALVGLDPSLIRTGWLGTKLILVILMSAIHMAMAKWRRAFAEGRNNHSQRFFRIMNEIPTLLLIGIVILVILKPS